MSHEMDVDDDNCLFQMLFDNILMLSIGCKAMILSTLIWLKLDEKWVMIFDKGFWFFTIWSFACVEVWSLGHDGSVSLSVVAQALL
jgi:hypothetical protein